MNMIIGAGALIVGVGVGFGGALAFRAAKYGKMKKEVKAHKLVLDAFAQAYRETLTNGWEHKIYRKVNQILKDGGAKVSYKVLVAAR